MTKKVMRSDGFGKVVNVHDVFYSDIHGRFRVTIGELVKSVNGRRVVYWNGGDWTIDYAAEDPSNGTG